MPAGIHNTQMYENACKLMAKQKVALECLSYHATASQQQTIKLVQDTIQSAEDYCLYTFQFVGMDYSLYIQPFLFAYTKVFVFNRFRVI